MVAAVRRKEGGLYHKPLCGETAGTTYANTGGLRRGDGSVPVEHHKLPGYYGREAVL